MLSYFLSALICCLFVLCGTAALCVTALCGAAAKCAAVSAAICWWVAQKAWRCLLLVAGCNRRPRPPVDHPRSPALLETKESRPTGSRQDEESQPPVSHQAEESQPPVSPQAVESQPPSSHQIEESRQTEESLRAEESQLPVSRQTEESQPPTPPQDEESRPLAPLQAEEPWPPAPLQAEEPQSPVSHQAEESQPPISRQAQESHPPALWWSMELTPPASWLPLEPGELSPCPPSSFSLLLASIFKTPWMPKKTHRKVDGKWLRVMESPSGAFIAWPVMKGWDLRRQFRFSPEAEAFADRVRNGATSQAPAPLAGAGQRNMGTTSGSLGTMLAEVFSPDMVHSDYWNFSSAGDQYRERSVDPINLDPRLFACFVAKHLVAKLPWQYLFNC
ncbi:hypothetical protein IWW39_006315, partial [Coemansia spiralis]